MWEVVLAQTKALGKDNENFKTTIGTDDTSIQKEDL